ncbi:hypothetical protein DQ04_06651020 [Trypanosoma grayi]|uniref:hypothetical protein n=1 Tax=Trypanosoma grayi TaxID=71804 RepID=UPI0004F441ED|nr:hypothetical protein DQ04_06651020 [Trypanosoma grayi]KEG08681.1 hypothetical protein DQ04_06651020 [Trypanosoma grayi]
MDPHNPIALQLIVPGSMLVFPLSLGACGIHAGDAAVMARLPKAMALHFARRMGDVPLSILNRLCDSIALTKGSTNAPRTPCNRTPWLPPVARRGRSLRHSVLSNRVISAVGLA